MSVNEDDGTASTDYGKEAWMTSWIAVVIGLVNMGLLAALIFRLW